MKCWKDSGTICKFFFICSVTSRHSLVFVLWAIFFSTNHLTQRLIFFTKKVLQYLVPKVTVILGAELLSDSLYLSVCNIRSLNISITSNLINLKFQKEPSWNSKIILYHDALELNVVFNLNIAHKDWILDILQF